MLKSTAYILILFVCLCACKKSMGPVFAETPEQFPVKAGVLDEASGIADSYANPGFLWVIQDYPAPAALYLLGHNGQHGKSIAVQNVVNRDWEELDISNGPEAGKNYLYIGDIGDNNSVVPNHIIYRFQEPLATTDAVTQVDSIRFTYPDGPHDSDAFFVDPVKKDIYIITKRDAQSKVYKLAYPQSISSISTAAHVIDLSYNGVVGAAASPRGGLLIKTYTNIYYYNTIEDMARGATATTLAYQVEPQGEAICFATDNSGFYTLSEKGLAASVNLNFYKRN